MPEDSQGFFTQNIQQDDLEPGPSQEAQDEFERKEQEEHDLNQHYKNVFATVSGQIVLADLLEIKNQPTWDARLGLFNSIGHGFVREGQNHVIDYINTRILKADTKDPKTEKPTRKE